jgi:hypothetical protein
LPLSGSSFEFRRACEIFSIRACLIIRKYYPSFEEIVARLLPKNHEDIVDIQARDLMDGSRESFTHYALLLGRPASPDVALKNCHSNDSGMR